MDSCHSEQHLDNLIVRDAHTISSGHSKNVSLALQISNDVLIAREKNNLYYLNFAGRFLLARYEIDHRNYILTGVTSSCNCAYFVFRNSMLSP